MIRPLLVFLLAAAPAAAVELRLAVDGPPSAMALVEALAPQVAAATGATVTLRADAPAAALAKSCAAELVVLGSAPLAEGLARERYLQPARPLMRTDYVLVGPAADPARAAGAPGAAAALKRIADRGARFASAGGERGGRNPEFRLWNAAGVDPRFQDWWREVDGPAALSAALARGAYGLVERADWLALADRGDARLLLENDPALRLGYVVAAFDAAGCGRPAQAAAAEAAVAWLTGPEGRRAIEDIRIGDGAPYAAP